MKTWLTKLGSSEFKVMRLQETAASITGDTPELVVNYLRLMLPSSIIYRPDTENMMVVFLSTRRKIIGFEIISNGTLDTILLHARQVFKPAIIINAAAIVLAHNHPTRRAKPTSR